MSHLYLDPGSSGTKVLAHDEFCFSYFVEAGVLEIAPLSTEEKEEEAWIDYQFGSGVVELDGKVYRVGGTPPICVNASSKGPGAILKAIAAIGSMDCGKGENYELGMLLPCDEFHSRKEVAVGIREGLPKAKFNGKKLIATIESIRIHPEGSGLIHRPRGSHVAVMVGHTDISLIRYESGRLNLTKSQTFSGVGVGAIAMSMGIPGSDTAIAKAISKGSFSELAMGGIPESLVRDANETHKKSFVRHELKPRFEAYPWSGVDSVVIGGGGAPYLKDELAKIIPMKVSRVKTPKGIRLFGNFDSRYFDLYGMAYRQLHKIIEAKLSGDAVQSVDCEVVV